MKKRFFLIMLSLVVFYACVFAQSITLNPASISPSSFNITVSTAGGNPTNPLTNYTSQSVRYSWPFLGDGLFGYIDVMSTTLPPGIGMTILATGSSGFWNFYGTATGTKTVSSDYQSIISGILSASNVSRGLTQNITISDFSQLRPGTYTVVINFRLQ
jgi:hypothetical protein